MSRHPINFSQDVTRCVVCRADVPEDREQRSAITCSMECAKQRKAALRRKRAERPNCIACKKPRTGTTEPADFRKWLKGKTAASEPLAEAEDRAGTPVPQKLADLNAETIAAHKKETLPFCVNCGDIVPEDRAKKNAVTCEEACYIRRRHSRRQKKEASYCKYCYHRSTPEQRAQYAQWRAETKPKRTEKDNSDASQPQDGTDSDYADLQPVQLPEPLPSLQ